MSRSLISFRRGLINRPSLSSVVVRHHKLQTVHLSSTATKYNNNAKLQKNESEANLKRSDGIKPQYSGQLSNWDKWMLVYTKTYPDKQSIPDVVPTSKMAVCRDKMRVKIALVLSVGCLAICFVVSVLGSSARRSGKGMKIDQYAREQTGVAHPEAAASGSSTT